MNSAAHPVDQAFAAFDLAPDSALRDLSVAAFEVLVADFQTLPQSQAPAAALAGSAPQAADNRFGAWAWRGERQTRPDGALAGVRVAVKDNIRVAGWPWGLGGGRRTLAHDDALLVRRLLDAGAVITGLAQCEDMVQGGESFTSKPDWVRNPWAPERSAGGSSSGSAALVAAGAVDLAIGTDSGGSIRAPAARCGVLGMKPTHGLVPYRGIASIEPSLEHAGPMSLSVALNREALRILSGGRFAFQHERRVEDLRIGVLMDRCEGAHCAPGIGRAVAEAIEQLARRGVQISFTTLPDLQIARACHGAIYAIGQAQSWFSHDGARGADADAQWAARMPLLLTEAPDLFRCVLAAGGAMSIAHPLAYAQAQAVRAAITRSIDEALIDVDALALPTLYDPPPRPPAASATPLERFVAQLGSAGDQPAFNLSGHPVLAVPIGLADDYPASLSLVGRKNGEGALYALAELIEPPGGFPPAPADRWECAS